MIILYTTYQQEHKLLTTIYLKNDILNTNSSFYPSIFYTTVFSDMK